MKIENKKLLIKQIWTILCTISCIVFINIFFNDLCANGLGQAFSIENYQEAFKLSASDIKIFNILRTFFIFGTLICCKEFLQSNKEIADIDREIANIERREKEWAIQTN